MLQACACGDEEEGDDDDRHTMCVCLRLFPLLGAVLPASCVLAASAQRSLSRFECSSGEFPTIIKLLDLRSPAVGAAVIVAVVAVVVARDVLVACRSAGASCRARVSAA